MACTRASARVARAGTAPDRLAPVVAQAIELVILLLQFLINLLIQYLLRKIIHVSALQRLLDAASDPKRALGLVQRPREARDRDEADIVQVTRVLPGGSVPVPDGPMLPEAVVEDNPEIVEGAPATAPTHPPPAVALADAAVPGECSSASEGEEMELMRGGSTGNAEKS